MGKDEFSLDKILDKRFPQEVEEQTAQEIFDEGFKVYRTLKSIFLTLTLETNVITTCPINSTEDIIKVKIKYNVNEWGDLIEHHSFLRWVESFKKQGMGLEDTVDNIYTRISEIVNPTRLKVIGKSHSNFKSSNKAVRQSTF